MAVNDRLFLFVKLLGALGGLVGGGLAAIPVVILAMIFAGSTFGLENILPAAAIGAGIGFVLGFCFPKIGKTLFELFSSP